jgi:hypothetical protein
MTLNANAFVIHTVSAQLAVSRLDPFENGVNQLMELAVIQPL